MHRKLAIILVTLLLAPACALGDSIWIATSSGNALELTSVTVTGISDGKVLYQVAGRDANRDLTAVVRMKLDSEPDFSAAEQAFAAGNKDVAARLYQAASRANRKPWLKARIDARLASLAPKPAVTTPPAGPAGAAVAPQPAPAGVAASANVKAKLDAIAAMLTRNEFQPAMTEIHLNRPLFSDPAAQAKALFYLAQAEAGLAAVRSDSQAWQDVALAYMRVVAHFPASPLAPQALLQVAQIEKQQLNDPAAARAIYQQISNQYASDPAAATAKEQLK
jgi:hypothetical protein